MQGFPPKIVDPAKSTWVVLPWDNIFFLAKALVIWTYPRRGIGF
jgi:hypothetical protein